MSNIKKGDYCWIHDPSDEALYTPAKALTDIKSGGKGTVQNQITKATYEVAHAKLRPMDEQSLSPHPDMVNLNILDEGSLLHNLRLRYNEDNIYTNIGSILVSVNPFKKLNIYSPEVVDQYIQNGGHHTPPHIFGVSDNAYRNLINNKKNQSCIVSGESGAGKTEATKLFLQYLAEKSTGGNAASDQDALHERILEANPLMEAFGNAKTVRNNNSSRFGKLIQVDFDSERGQVVGGNINQYLLEKSRVVQQAEGERNYHIFYEMCANAESDSAMKSELKLTSADQYYYTNQSEDPEAIFVDGIDDLRDFGLTKRAMETMDISAADQKALFKALAGILHLGNVQFTGNDEQSAVKDEAALKLAADMLDVDPAKLGEGMIKRKIMTAHKNHSLAEAGTARDAFAKTLYGHIFDWIISKINASLKKGSRGAGAKNSISVLDIFGFESFALNSFEQLCINYCNEKLQSHFNDHIFSLEQAEYKKEGINIENIVFTDNSAVLQCIEAKTGVLGLLNEEAKLPKGTDANFLKRVLSQTKDNILVAPDVKKMKEKRFHVVFTVVHYAGPVDYTVTNFLEKNKDRLLDDLEALGKSSKSKYISSLFGGASSGSKKETLASQFKKQLASLMTTLNTTEPHYVRTVKPNSEKVGNLFTAEMVLEQIKYAGLMEVCRIRKLGYPIRKSFKDFTQRFRPLAQGTLGKGGDEATAQALADDLLKQKLLTAGEYQKGKTQMFFRNNQYNLLEDKRESALHAKVVAIQKYVRRWVARYKFKQFAQILKKIETATKSGNEEQLEKALQDVGKLPHHGIRVPVVIAGKKMLSQLQEKKKIVALIKDAIKSRDINAIDQALEEADRLKIKDPAVDEAKKVKGKIKQEKSTKVALEAALKANDKKALEKALKDGDKMGMQETSAYVDAKTALDTILKEEETIKALDAAIKAKDVAAIEKYNTIMAEIGKADHPSVKKGEAITKKAAEGSKEQAAKKMEVERKLEEAVESKNLKLLKELNPSIIKFGITGPSVDKAKGLLEVLQKREEKFSEVSAVMRVKENKSKEYNGVDDSDVKDLEEKIKGAIASGFKEDDEEIADARAFVANMKQQIAVNKEVLAVIGEIENRGKLDAKGKKALDSKAEKILMKVNECGLVTGPAKRLKEELSDMAADRDLSNIANAEKIKERIKKELHEGTEDDRSDEKADLMAERTKKHQELVASASDNAYDFSKFLRIREDADYIQNVPKEAKAAAAEGKLVASGKPILKSLIQFPDAMSNTALQVNKAILQYCGDFPNPYPNTMARFMIVTALEQPALVDEIYLQLIKHTNKNKRPVSEDRAWGLLCLATSSFPPSEQFAPFLVNYLLNSKGRGGLVGNYAKLCIVQLDGRIRLGPTKLLPDLKVIDTYSQRPPILAVINRVGDLEPLEVPVSPDEDLDRVLLDTVYDMADIKEADQYLYGVFVIDGKSRGNVSLIERLTYFYKKYNPAKLVHVEYFAKCWEGNEEALFHRITKKYGPEPTNQEIAAMNGGKKDKKNLLRMPITAAKEAAKRLGMVQNAITPPAPESSWPLPWWVYLGDIFLRMTKQGVEPVFTFKRKLYKKGEENSPAAELIDQARTDVIAGDLAIPNEADQILLSAMEMVFRHGKGIKTAEQLIDIGLQEILPLSYLSQKTPEEIAALVIKKIPECEQQDTNKMRKDFFEICKKAPSFGMAIFYLHDSANPDVPIIAGVDTAGIHIMDRERKTESDLYVYKKIKEFGATSNYFWMKVVENKSESVKYLNTIQAWDIYGLVYDYTHNAQQLKLV